MKYLLALIISVSAVVASGDTHASAPPVIDHQIIYGAYCCDSASVRRCVLVNPAPAGASCFCYGQGYGHVCI